MKNIAAFLAGWMLMLALALGMEPARAQACPSGMVADYKVLHSVPAFPTAGDEFSACIAALNAGFVSSFAGMKSQALGCQRGAYGQRNHVVLNDDLSESQPIHPAYYMVDSQGAAQNSGYWEIRWDCVAEPPPPDTCVAHPANTIKSFYGQGQPGTLCLANCLFSDGFLMEFGSGAWSVIDAVSSGAYCLGNVEGSELAGTGPGSAVPTAAGDFKPVKAPDATPQQLGQRCGYLNGEYTCLAKPSGNGQCTALSGGAGLCVVSGVQTPDVPPAGSSSGAAPTPVETVHSSTGQGPPVITNIYNNLNPGSSSGASSGASSSSSSGGSTSSSSSSGGNGECDPLVTSCGGSAGDFNAPGTGYTFADASGDLTTAREARAAELDTIRAEAAALFGAFTLPTGRLPSWEFSVMGNSVVIDLNVFAEKVAFLGAVLVFLSLVSAAFIIMGGRD